MNLIDLTPLQLKRAAAIKEQIEALNKELSQILGERSQPKRTPPGRKRLSASARDNIAAAQQARWAKFRARKRSTGTVTAAAKAKKKTTRSAANSNRSAKMKAYWAAKKAGKK